MTDTFAPACPFCGAVLPPDDPRGDRHVCPPANGPQAAPDSPEDVLDSALFVAREFGCYVFPVDHPALPKCAGLHGPNNPCDGKRGKHPCVKFSLDATNSDREIIAIFAGTTRNYGVETRRSRLLVIDEDTASLDDYAASIGQTVPETFEVSTGRGRHLWFRVPPGVELTNSRGRLPKGIDVRAGKSGYVIGPGSLHESGARYRATWDRSPVPAPQWLIDALTPQPADDDQADGTRTDVPEHIRRMLAEPVEVGERSERFFAIVAACRETGMSKAATIAVLTPWCQRVGKYIGRVAQEVNRCWPKADSSEKVREWLAGLPENGPGVKSPTFDADFWGARPYLKHIRDAAHARQRSAPAVLGVVLARVAALIDHRLRIPPIVGSDVGLSLITVVLAPPGVGKSTASHIGSQLLPAPAALDVADDLPLGSGEGFVEVFFGMVDEDDEPDRRGNPKTKKVRKQVRHNAFFYVDEGQVLAELGTRKNAILLPTIRSAFSGTTIGQANASEERRRILPAGSYTIGMVIAMQTVLAGPLLDDAAGGTPQRMLWLPATDPTIPDDPPTWPGLLPWTPPGQDALNRLRNDGWLIGEQAYIEVAEPIRREIRAADLARARGEVVMDLLDAHAHLLRLKVAALLAILDGRLDVGEEDWQLASAVKQVSDVTRTTVEAAVKAEAAKQEAEKSERLANRQARADAVVTERRIDDCARRIAHKVWADPERWTRSELRRSMRYWREVFDEGLERAIVRGWVVEHAEPGQGDDKRRLRPGEVRPR